MRLALALTLLLFAGGPAHSHVQGPDSTAAPAVHPFYRIQVVDRATGRGVPLIELRTTYGGRYLTDSAGVVAFFEPGLMGEELWFHVAGHGYEHPADGFGYRGVRLTPTRGGRATITVDRINLAERLYRMTGTGIYRDSVLVGDTPPLAKPLVNAQITGQDSALAHVFGGKIYWFWGDTGRLSYPLGLFKTAGATSALPSQGGLAPGAGVDFDYYQGPDGFARNVAPVPGTGVVWIDAVSSAPNAQGQLRMFSHFERRQGLGDLFEKGLLVWNDATGEFEKVADFALDEQLHPFGWQPLIQDVNGVEYLYFAKPYPNLRVRRELAALVDPSEYEAYSPLVPGTRFDGKNSQIERDQQNKIVWAWKKNTAPVNAAQQRQLINAGLMTRAESPFRLFDVDTGKQVKGHTGTVAWNDYLGKYLMILCAEGSEESYLGEIYAAAADSLEGPWSHARKIVSHDRYTLYNVAQRPFFDEDNGRLIYFEGTYTHTFSATEDGTPWYDYNQIMYRLDLSDPRLFAK